MIGISTVIETTSDHLILEDASQEAATVRILPDGALLVQSGVATTGQRHYTAFAQIVALAFSVPRSIVQVQMDESALPVI